MDAATQFAAKSAARSTERKRKGIDNHYYLEDQGWKIQCNDSEPIFSSLRKSYDCKLKRLEDKDHPHPSYKIFFEIKTAPLPFFAYCPPVEHMVERTDRLDDDQP